MLKEEDLAQIRKQLEESSKPVYFFDDDPDGVASFLLLYRYKKEGRGVIIKARSVLNMMFLKKAEEYGADRIFVLDIPEMDEEVQDKLNTPTTWIDHHDTIKTKKIVSYFNPRTEDKEAYIPTAYLCYKALKTDMWVAAIGCIGDYYLPDFMEELKEKYPKLTGDANLKDIADIKYNSNLGKLIKMFSFLMMGSTKNALTNVKILTRIEDPAEIIENTTSRAKLLNKYYNKINNQYKELYQEAIKTEVKDNILLYLYNDDKISLTKDLANELSAKNQDTIIIVGRVKSGEIKMSVRWNKDIKTPFTKVFEEIEGYGGGHTNSCGGVVKEKDRETFIKLLKSNLNKP
jgi:hypothetical protein